jgi:ATP-dependent exoDNAse (exonuclease V) beta subunit
MWLTGIFDRVVVERDAANRPIKAWVIDFKTDRSRTGEDNYVSVIEKHAGQLNLYRQVVAVLTGLSVQVIRATLVLTASNEAMDVSLTD